MPEKPITPPKCPEPRVGYQTTEFWVSVVAALGAIAAQVAGLVPEPWGAVLAGVSSAAYAISRGLAKSGTTSGP